MLIGFVLRYRGALLGGIAAFGQMNSYNSSSDWRWPLLPGIQTNGSAQTEQPGFQPGAINAMARDKMYL